MDGILKSGERLDDLHRNNYKIIQNPLFFSFGMDAVLLSAFAQVNKNEKHLDLCCGNGIVPILLAARFPDKNAVFCGIEIQAPLADMAARSVVYNSLGDKVSMVCGDIKDEPSAFDHAYFDVITANPPYMAAGSGFENEGYETAVARHEILCNLDDVCAAASRLLRFGGRFYMVHRPSRLADAITSLRKFGLEPKTMRFVQPKAGSEPNTLLIMATKGGKVQLNVAPPLIIYDDDGKYTEEVFKIYYG